MERQDAAPPCVFFKIFPLISLIKNKKIAFPLGEAVFNRFI